jgi:hypothetical protein
MRVTHYTPFCDEYDGGEPADQITSEPDHVTCAACLALLREEGLS